MSLPSTIKAAYGWLVGRDFNEPLRRGYGDADDIAWFSSGWGVQSSTGIRIDQSTAMSCAAVMSCVKILSEDVSKLRPQLWRPKKAGRGKELADDHYLAPFLRRPNDWQTWGEFCTQMMVGLLLRGNGYAVIVRNNRGLPVCLVPVNPDRVALWESPDGSLFWMVTRAGLHELAVLRHEPLLIPYRDMFHLKGLSANGLMGLSVISMNREAIGLALAQEQQAARWMGNAAKPSGILTTDQKMTQDSYDRSKKAWQDAQSGLVNSGKTAMLEMGLKFQALSMTSADIEFIASRTYQLQEIARMFRIPPHMIGELSRGTNNNITQQSQEYFNATLSTYTRIWQERLDFTFGLAEAGIEMGFDRSILLEGDIQARFGVYRLGLQGILTTNECRQREGLDPIEDDDDLPPGDQVFRPVNMVPLSSDLFGSAATLEPENIGNAGVGSDMGGENPGAGAPSADHPNPNQAP